MWDKTTLGIVLFSRSRTVRNSSEKISNEIICFHVSAFVVTVGSHFLSWPAVLSLSVAEGYVGSGS